jgi:hypothetical protein
VNGEGVEIRLDGDRTAYRPGEVLSGQYRLDLGDDPGREVRSVELSVLWHSEGKGDEDLGLCLFKELSGADGEWIDPREVRKFSARLPGSPLSYDGILVKILWCVRVRVASSDGSRASAEVPFVLGGVAPAAELPE